MAIPSWGPGLKRRAKEEAKYLAKIELNGRYAKTGPGSTIGLASDLPNDATAHALMAVIQVVSFGPGSVPKDQREPALRGMMHLLEMMLSDETTETTIASFETALEMVRETFGLPKPTT